MKCEKCGNQCELCAADWPYNPDYWICPDCDSTYIYEEKGKSNRMRGKMATRFKYIEDFPERAKFLFITMMHVCIEIKEKEKDQEFFLKFCLECWKTMEMNDIDVLKETFKNMMKQEFNKVMKKFNEMEK